MPETFNPGDAVTYTAHAVVIAVDDDGVAFLNDGQAIHVDNLVLSDGG